MATALKSFGNNLDFRICCADSSGNSTANWKDISDWVMSVDGLPGEREMADVTCGGGSVAHAWLPGMMGADITLECLFDQTTGSAYDVLSGYTGDTYHRHWAYYPAGQSSGYPMMHGACWVKSITLGSKPLEPLMMSVSLVLDSTITVTTCST
jgi:hypothetical protein